MAEPRSRAPLVVALLVAALVALLLLLPAAEPERATRPAGDPAPVASAPRVELAPVPTAATASAPTPAEAPAPAERPVPAATVSPVESAGILADARLGLRLVRVRGQVVDAAGAPQAGVPVELHGTHERDGGGAEGPAAPPEVGQPFAGRLLEQAWGALRARLGAARTTAGGRFEVVVEAGPLQGIDQLVAAAEDADGAIALALVVPRPDADGLVDLGRLVLRLTSRIEVVARGDGLPLEGAVVRIHGSIPLGGDGFGDEHVVLEAETDASGLAVLRHQGHDLALHARCPGRAGVIRWLARDGPLPPLLRLELDLPPATGVRGVVRDARGAPLSGVRVRADPVDDALLNEETLSDAEGRFLLPSLALGVGHDLQAHDPSGDHVEAAAKLVPPSADLELRLADASSVVVNLVPAGDAQLRPWRWDLTVTARRADAAAPGGWTPLAGVLVEEPDDWRPRPGARQREPLTRNQVRVVGLTPGRYRLHVSVGDDGSSGWSEEVEVRLGEEAAASVPLAPGLVLRGRLVDAAGTPLPRVQLELSYDLRELGTWCRCSLSTDEEGRFELERLVPEVKQVTLGRDGFEPRLLTLGSEGDVGDVALTPAR